MKKNIDARGLSCPQPVLLAQRAIKESPEGIVITVDNYAARENLLRLGAARGFAVSVEAGAGKGEATITFSK